MSRYFDMKPVSDFRFVLGPNILTQVTYVIVLPVFFIIYSVVYNPFGIQQYYEETSMGFGFNIIMVTCIMLATLAVTRTAFAFVIRRFELSRGQYLSWCLFEVFAVSAFIALYTSLMRHSQDSFLTVLETCMIFCYMTLIHPYLYIYLARTVMSKNAEIAAMEAPKDNSLVRFYDEHKRLKLTIAPSSILYVRSELNYVVVYYLDAGKVKNYQIRCSMKSIEDSADKHFLCRCQRSYFVNPEHVTVLRKDKEGFIFAELNIPDLPPIPVGKTYFNTLSATL